jgi:phage shock protein PspC (stress-responsive transcriptional regulator)
MSDPEPTPYQPPQQQDQSPFRGPSPKRLTRSRDDRMIAGVCGGVARYLNVDVTLVRVVMAVALLVGFLAPGIAYLIAWALMPEE